MKLSGLLPALLTPLHEDGAVDHDALAALTSDLLARGIDGLVPLGSTGEFTEFTAGERADIVRTVVSAASGRVPVLAGVSGLSTADTARHAAHAGAAGADAVLVLPPLYWKGPDDRVLRHFSAVADSAGTPVVVYDFPALTGQPLSPDLLATLAAAEPRVIGAKLTVRDLTTVVSAIDATRARRAEFAVVTGFEDLIPGAMAAGAAGAISGMANVVPDEIISLMAAVRARGPEVGETYRAVIESFSVYGLSVPAIPGLKAAAAALGRIPRSTSRLDAGPPAGVERAAREWAVRRSGGRGVAA